MIETVTTANLGELLEVRGRPCVSLVLQTEHGHVGAEAAKLELKNLLSAARDEVSTVLRPRAIVAEDLDRPRIALGERYREFAGTGATSVDPRHIAELAAEGGVDTLFLARGARAWATVDSAEPLAGDHEYVNDAVTDTLANGGTVEPFEDLSTLVAAGEDMPIVAALLRHGRI